MRRRPVLAILLLLAAGPAAAQDDPVATVNGFLAASTGPFVASATAAAVVPASAGVRIDGLSLGFFLPQFGEAPTRWTFAAPTVFVDGLARTADGFRADAIRVPAATVTPGDGAAAERLGAIEIVAPSWALPTTGSASGPAAALEAPLRFFAGLSAERAALSAPTFTATLGPVTRGRIARATVAPAAESPVEIADLDLAAIADALFSTGGSARLALGRFSARDVAADDGSRIAALTLEGVSLTPQSPPLAARIDDYLASRIAAPPPPADPDAPKPPPTPEEVDLGLAVWSAIAVERMAVDGVSSTPPQGKPVAFSAALANLGADRAADIRLSGLKTTADDGSAVAVGEVALLGFRAPPAPLLRTAILAGDAPPSPDVMVGLIPVFSRAHISGVTVDSPAVSVTVDEASVSTSGHIGTIPTLIEIVARGAVDLPEPSAAPTPEGQAALAALAAQGISRIDVDAGSRLAWADGRIDYTSHIAAPDLGRYRESYAISGIPRWVFTEPARALEIVAFLALDRARFEASDEGALALARGVVDAAGPGTFDSEAAVGIAELDATLVPTLGEANAAIVRDALTRFLLGKRTIVLEAKPERPVPLTQVGAAAIAPRALVDLLKLTLTVTP